MNNSTITRGIGAVAATALVLSGASLALAAPAHAATTVVTQDDISPSEAAGYFGWHEGYANAEPAYSVQWDGLHIGDGADSQIVNGLVETGAPGIPTTAEDLSGILEQSYIAIDSGAAFWQVAVTTAEGWGTLRPVDGDTTTHPVTTDELWTSSKDIGDVTAGESIALGDLLASLEADDDFRYSAFGVLADASNPAVVQGINWGADYYSFLGDHSWIPVTSEIAVTGAEIRPNEDTYTGWHEGYANETPAYSVTTDGLHLGDGANSQIINGLAEPLMPENLGNLLISTDITASSGAAFYQVPIFFGEADTFATLRPEVPISGPHETYTLWDNWLSSKAIGETATTAEIPANTPVRLGDLVEALEAHGEVEVLGFGVLAQEPTVVQSIIWNGVKYNFVPPAITPVTPLEPAKPELAATGVQGDLGLTLAALMLLAGLGIGATRVARRSRA